MGDSAQLSSDTLCRTRSLVDLKTFTVFAELTKPSQSVVTIISSVRTDLLGFEPVADLSQETVAGDAVSRSFRPGLPGNEYPTLHTKPPAPSQDSEEYDPTERGDSQIVPNHEGLYGPRFSNSSPIPNEPRGRIPLGGSRRSNSRERGVGTSHSEWKPEQLSNGNYRQAPSFSLGFNLTLL